jgi:hypothetical protein
MLSIVSYIPEWVVRIKKNDRCALSVNVEICHSASLCVITIWRQNQRIWAPFLALKRTTFITFNSWKSHAYQLYVDIDLNIMCSAAMQVGKLKAMFGGNDVSSSMRPWDIGVGMTVGHIMSDPRTTQIVHRFYTLYFPFIVSLTFACLCCPHPCIVRSPLLADIKWALTR